MTKSDLQAIWQTALALLVVVLGVWGAYQLIGPTPAQRHLQQESEEMNKTLPKMIDMGTRLDKIFQAADGSWHYHYTLVLVRPGQITDAQLQQQLHTNIVEGYRNGAAMADFRAAKATLVYEFYDQKDGHIGDVTTGPADLPATTKP